MEFTLAAIPMSSLAAGTIARSRMEERTIAMVKGIEGRRLTHRMPAGD
jgi:hypothetical protein